MVQTDGLVLNSTEAANVLELQNCETEQRLEEQESSVNWEHDSGVQDSSATEYPETEVSVNFTSEEETGRQEHLEETETERYAGKHLINATYTV